MFQWAPWADLLYACDFSWWQRYNKEIKNIFKGEKWALEPQAAQYGASIIESNTQGKGLGRNGIIHTGGNSGFQVINLLYLFGSKKIILLGFDMKTQGKKTHCHGDHPYPLNRHSDYNDWVRRFTPLAIDLRNEGIEIINATRETALDCFDRLELENALC